jgi:hypothetical protein
VLVRTPRRRVCAVAVVHGPQAGDKAGYLSKDDATLAPHSPSFSYWPSIVAGEPATSEIADGEGGGARFASDRRADSDDALVASGP